MRKIIAAVVAAILLYAGTLLALPTAAHAAGTEWAPQPPGTGWLHGQLLTDLPLCSSLTEPPSSGGWDMRDFSSTAPSLSWLGKRDITRANTIRLNEPCLASKPPTPTDNITQYLRIRYHAATLPIGSTDNGGAGGTAPWDSASYVFGTDTYTANGATEPRPTWDTRIFCGSAEWTRSGNGQTIYTANTRQLQGGYQQQPTDTVTNFTMGFSNNLGFNRVATPTALSAIQVQGQVCRYVSRIDLTVCEFNWVDGVTDPVRTCKLATWWAGDYQTQKPYENHNDPQAEFCKRYPTYPGCAFIDPDVDPGSPTLCDSAHPFLWSGNWLDFSWVPAAFNHLGTMFAFYGKCMFVPLGGWDRNGWVSSAWSSSVAGEVASAASDAIGAYQWGDSCGVIGSGTGTTWGIVNLNTCTWSAWAGPAKVVLSWGVLIAGGWFILHFVWATAMSVINRKIPTPFQLGRTDEK